MSETLISTMDGKYLFAKSASSATRATLDSNGDKIDETYAKKSLVDQLGSGLTGVQATLYPQEGKWNSAASTLSANSGNWQDSYETVTANSADWGNYPTYTAGNGIEIDENNGINVKRALDLADSGADKAKLSVGTPAGPLGVYGTIIDGKGITAGMQAPASIEAPRTVIGATDIVVNKYEGASPIPGLSNISVTGLAANKQDASAMTAYQPVIEYGYDSNSKITAIDGTALAGGGGGDTSMCYPLTGGNLKGQLIASGAGSPSTAQTAPVYGKITATQRQNQAGLMTNGSVFAGDYKGTASQTIAVRRSAANSALAGRFQLYSDGAVSFQQISNDGTADSIVCQLQYGQTNTGFNWGTMASGSTVKHIAYTEDLTGQGKTYEGVEPIVVDNTANTISITGLDQFQKTADMTAYQPTLSYLTDAAGNIKSIDGTSLAGIVNRDNTLTGDGSESSPLGVNRSSISGNETILWNGVARSGSWNIKFSEPITHFKHLRILFRPHTGAVGDAVPRCYELSAGTGNIIIHAEYFIGSSPYWCQTMQQLALSTTALTWNFGVTGGAGATAFPGTSNYMGIYAVYGLNRTANG